MTQDEKPPPTDEGTYRSNGSSHHRGRLVEEIWSELRRRAPWDRRERIETFLFSSVGQYECRRVRLLARQGTSEGLEFWRDFEFEIDPNPGSVRSLSLSLSLSRLLTHSRCSHDVFRIQLTSTDKDHRYMATSDLARCGL